MSTVEINNIDTNIENSNTLDLHPKVYEAKKECKESIVSAVKKEYSIVGDALYASINAEEAPQWLNNIIDSVVASGLSKGLLDLKEAKDTITTALSELSVAKNQYQELINIDATIDSVIASRLETLNATIDQNSADIRRLDVTKVTEDQAATIAAEQISAELNNGAIRSEINRIDSAITDTNSSLVNTTEMLEADYLNLSEGMQGNASAVNNLYSYVGYDSKGVSLHKGLIADIETLKKQNDGVINTYTGTYDVILNALSDPTSDDELVTTAEPYASWAQEDATNGNMDARLRHIGDVYIKYKLNSNSTKEYIASFKFVKTTPDFSSPYSTDADGFTWAVVVDQAAQDAYMAALNAYELADGKMSTYYKDTLANLNAMSTYWSDKEKQDHIGDIAIVHSDPNPDNNTTYHWSGTEWQVVRDGKLIALSGSVTNLTTELTSGNNTWAKADSTLENTLRTEITDKTTKVENKFAYGSTIGVNGKYYSSGFGITSSYNSGSGTETDPYDSEFWVNAKTFALSNGNDSIKPFEVKTYSDGSPAKVIFNGNVSINSLVDNNITANKVTVGRYLGEYSNSNIPVGSEGDTYFNTDTSTMMYRNKNGWVTTKGQKGDRGAGWYSDTVSVNPVTGNWNDTNGSLYTSARNACPEGSPVKEDIVTLIYTDVNNNKYSLSKKWDGLKWVDPGLYVNGDLIVDGTISGNKIRTGKIQSNDGKFVIDLDNRFIRIEV